MNQSELKLLRDDIEVQQKMWEPPTSRTVLALLARLVAILAAEEE
jgi:hypothetical protein